MTIAEFKAFVAALEIAVYPGRRTWPLILEAIDRLGGPQVTDVTLVFDVPPGEAPQ